MFCQALFTFECFAAIIALESFLLSVGYFVALQITSWNTTVRALVTFVWFFSSVCSPHVDWQITSCDAWKITLWTFVRLFSRVGHLVQPHSYQCNWRIFTLTALVRLYPSVRHNVRLKMTSLSGWVVALHTLVWLLPRMSEQVCFQMSSLTKWFAALFTIVQLIPRMSKQVPFQTCS